jgi:DNA (cytosine-5)-methyltransferase 1
MVVVAPLRVSKRLSEAAIALSQTKTDTPTPTPPETLAVARPAKRAKRAPAPRRGRANGGAPPSSAAKASTKAATRRTKAAPTATAPTTAARLLAWAGTLPRPRALDIFCGGGGAGTGLRRAGFAAVVGVDIAEHRASYEHTPGMHFVRFDATALTPELVRAFDFVWASPPCQAFSSMVPKYQRERYQERWRAQGRHPELIGPMRALLQRAAVPFVIENVQGARAHMAGELLTLCGTMFDLRVFRHRLFERGGGLPAMPQPACNHAGRSVGIMSKGVRPPRTERYVSGDAAERGAGDAPPGLVAVEKRFPSHGDRVDHVYVGDTPEMTRRIRAMYGRSFVRSIKEALRLTGDLVRLDEDAACAERERYEAERIKGLPAPGTTQMYPVYGKQQSRGATHDWRAAMGIDWEMTRDEVRESIPPAYAEHIGRAALAHVAPRA